MSDCGIFVLRNKLLGLSSYPFTNFQFVDQRGKPKRCFFQMPFCQSAPHRCWKRDILFKEQLKFSASKGIPICIHPFRFRSQHLLITYESYRIFRSSRTHHLRFVRAICSLSPNMWSNLTFWNLKREEKSWSKWWHIFI